jgi:hypothetical protein
MMLEIDNLSKSVDATGGNPGLARLGPSGRRPEGEVEGDSPLGRIARLFEPEMRSKQPPLLRAGAYGCEIMPIQACA